MKVVLLKGTLCDLQHIDFTWPVTLWIVSLSTTFVDSQCLYGNHFSCRKFACGTIKFHIRLLNAKFKFGQKFVIHVYFWDKPHCKRHAHYVKWGLISTFKNVNYSRCPFKDMNKRIDINHSNFSKIAGDR